MVNGGVSVAGSGAGISVASNSSRVVVAVVGIPRAVGGIAAGFVASKFSGSRDVRLRMYIGGR